MFRCWVSEHGCVCNISEGQSGKIKAIKEKYFRYLTLPWPDPCCYCCQYSIYSFLKSFAKKRWTDGLTHRHTDGQISNVVNSQKIALGS